ncbi:hypothetical protein PR048_026728 [Dryococelus australis]|uniref:Uncharacterized protein n=1 Tax=Dryococelus australis TaxID=614101 RepID=A0ABQ9GM59_9NEOP|nr:hypothetical protein PR048_026728 [Dryococelus australis]
MLWITDLVPQHNSSDEENSDVDPDEGPEEESTDSQAVDSQHQVGDPVLICSSTTLVSSDEDEYENEGEVGRVDEWSQDTSHLGLEDITTDGEAEKAIWPNVSTRDKKLGRHVCRGSTCMDWHSDFYGHCSFTTSITLLEF